jgi:GNAT superfamily N-acetyltransferase
MFLIRNLRPQEASFLKEMLFKAIFVPPGEPALPASICDHPDLLKYHQNWGQEGDFALLALVEKQAVGAAWYRLHSPENAGYGFVAANIPEINIALMPAYRGQGIGSALLDVLIKSAQEDGFPALSLSVDLRNPAKHLYLRKGFVERETQGDSMKMVLAFPIS